MILLHCMAFAFYWKQVYPKGVSSSSSKNIMYKAPIFETQVPTGITNKAMVSVTIKICSLSPKLSIRVSFPIHLTPLSLYPVFPDHFLQNPTFLEVPAIYISSCGNGATHKVSLSHWSQKPLDYFSGLVPMLLSGSKYWENYQGSRRTLPQAACHLPLLPHNTSVYTDLFFLHYGIFFLLLCLYTCCSSSFHLTPYQLATPYMFFKIHHSVVLTFPSPRLDSPPSFASHSPLNELYYGISLDVSLLDFELPSRLSNTEQAIRVIQYLSTYHMPGSG